MLFVPLQRLPLEPGILDNTGSAKTGWIRAPLQLDDTAVGSQRWIVLSPPVIIIGRIARVVPWCFYRNPEDRSDSLFAKAREVWRSVTIQSPVPESMTYPVHLPNGSRAAAWSAQ